MRITKHHCLLIKTQKPKASKILSDSADWGRSSSWFLLIQTCFAEPFGFSLSGLSVIWWILLARLCIRGLINSTTTHIFLMNSWKSHGEWVDSRLSGPVLPPQWPDVEGVCLSVQPYQATAFGPRSAKATGINCAAKATTQQETVHDLSWDCSAPGRVWAIRAVWQHKSVHKPGIATGTVDAEHQKRLQGEWIWLDLSFFTFPS